MPSVREQIVRAHVLADRCMAQVADGDLPYGQREAAELSAKRAIDVASDLEALDANKAA